MDQPKIERVLKLMMILTDNLKYSVDELADKLEVTSRTIYRYLDTFENAGFLVERGVFPRLKKESKYFKNIFAYHSFIISFIVGSFCWTYS